jgi:hypothetical protein
VGQKGLLMSGKMQKRAAWRNVSAAIKRKRYAIKTLFEPYLDRHPPQYYNQSLKRGYIYNNFAFS